MTDTVLLTCPIRGPLNVSKLAVDGLTTSEEHHRISFIKFLLKKGYSKDHITVETTLIKNLGESGRNKLRADVIVYDQPASIANKLPQEEKLKNILIVAEIKRESSKKTSGINNQLKPAMMQMPTMDVIGVYWDDTTRLLFTKSLIESDGKVFIDINEDSLENLPNFKEKYRAKPLKYDDLSTPDNLVSILFNVANIMRSHGVNDEGTRYKETVKLILARYCDEREARSSQDRELSLQVLKGSDPKFKERVEKVYEFSARRYNKAKSLFSPVRTSQLKERTLRECIKLIQGIRFTDATNESMQQVFMSFVPAVFKKNLDQFFTPQSLIKTMVHMVDIGPNDTICDPAMGTADFLTAALEYRSDKGDDDIVQRIFGADVDERAYDLALINMILHKDGQSNLVHRDTIEDHKLWQGKIDVALCNPPFGSKSLEKRTTILENYDLGHQWTINSDGKWTKNASDIRDSQQLGILFIERCVKMLPDGGRVAIILPEGYLCTTTYGYIRQWIIENLRVIGLVELPRRIFTKSDADLRSNILVAQKLPKEKLKEIIDYDYPIFSEIVRKVGYKLGKGFSIVTKRDPDTGLEIRDEFNNVIIDSDFNGLRNRFTEFNKKYGSSEDLIYEDSESWFGARVSDVLKHPNLDLKPRRLTPKALINKRDVVNSDHVRLGDIADVISETVNLSEYSEDEFKLVEGIDIRAVEGTVLPQFPMKGWEIIQKKSSQVYKIGKHDIVIGLVRPERRNVGMNFSPDDNIVGSPDGIAVVRVKNEFKELYPIEWIFQKLRSENIRIQFWTESGGTSYGKLTLDHIRNVLLKKDSDDVVKTIKSSVSNWMSAQDKIISAWENIGSIEDRTPIINSPIFGLEPIE
ncbi:N-6 DNA methylase [Vibrio parahaemolyticus]|nr:N-6 DNA methylase [Vibrio parahaemolyticus]ELB2100154.1 N-6 DNA methylase [Vibrio parahaemolyticus]ELB2209910.1 N-6 DNA methylase [Vibrio parahaemolyticus]ELB2291772.1 N-6 DNA methylase [Vibrio parahaemolyticus]